MNASDRDLRSTDSRTLRALADGLKADAKALFPENKPEAMRLFHLFKKITAELHRRNNPALAHRFN